MRAVLQTVRCSKVDQILMWTQTYTIDKLKVQVICLIVANYWPGMCTTMYYGLCTDPFVRGPTRGTVLQHIYCVNRAWDRTTDWARQEEDPRPTPPLDSPFYLPLCSPCHGLSFTGWQQATWLHAHTHVQFWVFELKEICAHMCDCISSGEKQPLHIYEKADTHTVVVLSFWVTVLALSLPIEQHPKPCLSSSSLSLSSHLSCNLQG